MVEFESIKTEEIKFGNNNFIEVARKKAVSEENENEFISISKGFFTPDGQRRYKRSFALPIDQEVVEFVSSKIKDML
ncbi:MAG: hypothetical protein J7J38_02600 [Candidatus Aenigmarchaeota archaeon]|nr:hypothetical protein [Candidatus Aenigmarchaeota archaeon]